MGGKIKAGQGNWERLIFWRQDCNLKQMSGRGFHPRRGMGTNTGRRWRDVSQEVTQGRQRSGNARSVPGRLEGGPEGVRWGGYGR